MPDKKEDKKKQEKSLKVSMKTKNSLGKKKPKEYWRGVGRRKTATARVRIWNKGEPDFIVNGKKFKDFFRVPGADQIVFAPLRELNLLSKFKVTTIVRGGGFWGQAEAIRNALARALIKFNPDFHKKMRELGFLTRDSRMKERKKPGLKGARKSPQFSKR